MKSKKGLLSFILLLACATAVFFIGWIQFYVPAGQYGVMISKTGGVYEEPVSNGSIIWRWERLLPTNTQIRIFAASPKKFTSSVTGELPSASIYSAMLNGRPDFSYNFSVSVELGVKPELLPGLVKQKDLQDDKGLEQWLQSQADGIANAVVQHIMTTAQTDGSNGIEVIRLSTDSDGLLEAINAEKAFPSVNIASVSVNTFKMPDTLLYATAKETYLSYQQDLREALKTTVSAEAEQTANDYLQFERFGKLGAVLEAYPILIEFLAVSRADAVEAFNILDAIR